MAKKDDEDYKRNVWQARNPKVKKPTNVVQKLLKKGITINSIVTWNENGMKRYGVIVNINPTLERPVRIAHSREVEMISDWEKLEAAPGVLDPFFADISNFYTRPHRKIKMEKVDWEEVEARKLLDEINEHGEILDTPEDLGDEDTAEKPNETD